MGRDGRWLGDAGRCSWATGVHSGAGGRRLSGPVFLCGASRGKAERQKGRKAERQKGRKAEARGPWNAVRGAEGMAPSSTTP